MKTLDLYRIWEILNIVKNQENILSEKGIYPNILGHNSKYYEMEFEYFLYEYAFRVDADQICIFNDDQIPFEDYTNNDFSFIPKKLLSFNDTELMAWIEKEIKIRITELEENNQQKGNDFIADVMWRFSCLILIPIVFFVLLVIRPIKWLITGHYYPQDPQKVKKTWLYKWILKTGLGWFR